jgi:hypothetical protein
LAEVNQLKKFDLITQSEFNPSLYDFNVSAKILYIKKLDGNKYKIHTLFYWISENGELNIMTEADYVAIKENNDFKLSNFLFNATENWKTKIIGAITYHYYPEYIFNEKNALAANKRIANLSKIFDLNPKKLNYYIFENCNQLEEYTGFSYLTTKYLMESCGFYDSANDYLYTTSYEGENYSHEITHIINEKYPDSHYIITTGLAIYSGDNRVHLGHSFYEIFNKFNNYLEKNQM